MPLLHSPQIGATWGATKQRRSVNRIPELISIADRRILTNSQSGLYRNHRRRQRITRHHPAVNVTDAQGRLTWRFATWGTPSPALPVFEVPCRGVQFSRPGPARRCFLGFGGRLPGGRRFLLFDVNCIITGCIIAGDVVIPRFAGLGRSYIPVPSAKSVFSVVQSYEDGVLSKHRAQDDQAGCIVFRARREAAFFERVEDFARCSRRISASTLPHFEIVANC
jgi:hypothetical protein